MASSAVVPAGVDDIVREGMEVFEITSEAEQDNRRLYEEDIRFIDLLDQWPQTVRRQREIDARPCLVIDKLGPVVRQVINDARQNKPGIAVHPVDDDADPETAEILSGLIRNIEVASNAEVAYDTSLASAVKGGFGYFRINTRYTSDDTFDQDIVIERIANQAAVYGDPYSTAADSSDWNTSFVIDQIPIDVFKKRYKGAEAVDWKVEGYNQLTAPWWTGETVAVAEFWKREEIERQIVLLGGGDAAPIPDGDPRSAMLAQLLPQTQIIDLGIYTQNKAFFDALGFRIEGRPRPVKSFKVTQHVMTGVEELDRVEWAGKYIPIIPVYGEEAWIDGRRMLRGIVRAAKDPQRMLNYWRSASTELVALQPKAPFIGVVGQFNTDVEKWATANTQNWPFIEYDPVPGALGAPQRQPFQGPPAGALQEALNASDDIKAVTGIYDASLGARSNETSGRAIMARQREGDVSTFHYIDNLARALRHAGRVLIDLIPHVYSAPRVVRILGENQKPDLVKVNQKFMVEEEDPVSHELREIEKIYELGAGKYDVTVTTGPSYTTQRQEAADQMMQLVQARPELGALIGDLIAENLDWPGADEIAKRLKAMLPAQVQGENPEVAAMRQQIEQAQTVIAELKKQADMAQAEHELEERKADIDAYKAETDRLKVTQEGMSPEEVAAVVAQTVMQVLGSPDVLTREAEVTPEGAEYGAPPPMAGGPPMQPPIPPDAAEMAGPEGEE